MDQLSRELHLHKQHVDDQFTRHREYLNLVLEREREHFQRLLAEQRASLIDLLNKKFNEARNETDVKLADRR